MKHCGYCGNDTDTPCLDSKAARRCSHDVKPNDTASREPYHDPAFTPTCDWCDKDVPTACKGEQCALTCPNWPASETEGRKDDTGKVRFDLLPPELLFAVANILTFGAKKYSDRNWEKGMSWGRVFGACMRHMWAWWRGDKADDETGYSHLWHAGCCIAFLIAYEERGIGEDDRNKDTSV